jgi:hypothetical protein
VTVETVETVETRHALSQQSLLENEIDMTEKYKNRYRFASTRATWWSYDWAGAYFITICTKNRQHFF